MAAIAPRPTLTVRGRARSSRPASLLRRRRARGRARGRVGVAALLILGLSLAGPFGPAGPFGTPIASAATGNPAVSAPASVATGSLITVSGSGFTPGRSVAITFGIVPAGTATVGSTGSFSTSVTVPSTVIAGAQPLAATESVSRRTATTGVSVRTDWLQTGGDAAHTGVNAAQVLLDRSTAGSAAVKWTAPSGVGYPSGTPVVGNGLLIATGSDAIVARRTYDGSQVWRTVLSGSTPTGSGSPVVAGSLLLVGTSTGEIRALNLTTGAQVWSRSFIPGATSASATSLVVSGDQVFAVITDYSGPGPTKVTVVALAVADGKTRWSTALSSRASLAVADGRVYVATQTGKLAALSTTAGNFLWVRQTPAYSFGELSVSGGLVLAATDVDETDYGSRGPGPVGVAAFDANTGASRWTWASGYPQGSTNRPAVADGAVQVAAVGGEFDYYFGAVFASLDLTTGQVRWTTEIAMTGAETPPTNPVVAGGVVWTGSCGPNAKFLGLDADTGAKLRDVFYVRCGAAVAVNSRVFVVDQNNTQALGLPTELSAVRSVDDDDTGTGAERIAYAGPWTTVTTNGAYGGGLHTVTTVGSQATVTFTGVGVRYWFSTLPDGGSAQVQIDGTTVGTVDQYAAPRSDGLTSWTSPVLSRGTHTLTITARAKTTAASAGNRVSLDRIDIAH